MSKTIVGFVGATEQPLEYGYTQGRGPFQRRTFKCTDVASAQSIAQQLISSGFSVTVVQGPTPMVIAEASAFPDTQPNDPSQVTDVWEKSVVPVQKDILETDFARSELSASDLDILAEFKKAGTITDANYALLTADGRLWYDALVAGTTSLLVYQTVLRHTRTVNGGYTLNWTITNEGRVLTNAQLSTLEGLPNDLKFAIPASAFTATFLKGWLKVPATVQQSTGDKWIVTQEYQYGEWLNLLYDAAT